MLSMSTNTSDQSKPVDDDSRNDGRTGAEPQEGSDTSLSDYYVDGDHGSNEDAAGKPAKRNTQKQRQQGADGK